MLSMQHALLAYFQRGNDLSPEYLGGTLLPDAIRRYSGPRQLSHFERSDDGLDSSWWTMPTDLSSITKETVQASLAESSHLAENKKAPFGQETDIQAFLDHNEGMKDIPELYDGVLAHLSAQDMVFDAFVRNNLIDMNGMIEASVSFGHNGSPVFDGTEGSELYLRPDAAERVKDLEVLDIHVHEVTGRSEGSLVSYAFDSDADARKYVTRIEQEGIYLLAKQLYEEQGITADQNWFDIVVREKLGKVYQPDLLDATMKYMKLDPEINTLIHNHDWSYVNNLLLPQKTFQAMYDLAIDGTSAVDLTHQPYLTSMRDVDVLLDAKLHAPQSEKDVSRYQWPGDKARAPFAGPSEENKAVLKETIGSGEWSVEEDGDEEEELDEPDIGDDDLGDEER